MHFYKTYKHKAIKHKPRQGQGKEKQPKTRQLTAITEHQSYCNMCKAKILDLEQIKIVAQPHLH